MTNILSFNCAKQRKGNAPSHALSPLSPLSHAAHSPQSPLHRLTYARSADQSLGPKTKPVFPDLETYGHYLDKRETSFAFGQQFARTLLGVFTLTEHLWQNTTFLYGFVSLLPTELLRRINGSINNEITYREIVRGREDKHGGE